MMNPRAIAKNALLVVSALVRRDSSPKVVFYHDIGKRWTPMGTAADVFWSHMGCLRTGDVVCFDDGFRGIWDERERLGSVSRKFTVVVFIAVALVGKKGYLTWDEIRELQNKHGVEFQSHTWSHQTLAGPWNEEAPAPRDGRTDAWFAHEIVDSKAEIERRLGSPVTALCFPVGRFNDDVVGRCKAAGYKQVFASYPGNATAEYVQPRCIAQDLSAGAFKAALNGGMGVMKARYYNRHFAKGDPS